MRVVVPSRSYYGQESPDKPLLGWRIAVKDMFDISGSQTTLCNRAWGDFHGVKSTTASSIRRLQDLGACIVGKTRLNAMLVREETMECVEFLAPFNPRGDGYQTSSGSSSGSCAALGAYPWIDFAIGSDSMFSYLPFLFRIQLFFPPITCTLPCQIYYSSINC
jgi:Asp-tRNA(Asn)/Glu-tRNA(Gln) amidotransferase A subunit family amidase